MSATEHEYLALLGVLGELNEGVRGLLSAQSGGGVNHISEVVWNPNDTLEDDYRGQFRAVSIFNKGPGIMRVSFDGPGGVRTDGAAAYLLRPFDSVTVPYRGSIVYYGGALAGAATITYLERTEPFEHQSGGGMAGQSAASPAFADVIDRSTRQLGTLSSSNNSIGRVSRGQADSLLAGGRVVAPGVGAAIAATGAGVAGNIFEIFVSVSIGAGGLAADSGNVQLQEGGAVLAVLAVNAPGDKTFGPIRRTNVGNAAYSVNAIAAGTAAVPYSATIAATRLE